MLLNHVMIMLFNVKSCNDQSVSYFHNYYSYMQLVYVVIAIEKLLTLPSYSFNHFTPAFL